MMSVGSILLGSGWGLAGLAAVPAIVAIHLFRRRFAPTPVTGLFLYGERRETVVSGRSREPVRLRRSLWLEIACALALTWWLADPHLSDREHARTYVVIIDSCVRMQARPVDGGGSSVTSWQRAQRALSERMAEWDERDRVTVISSGTPPRLIAGPGASPAEALAVVTAFAPTGMFHDLDEALALAAETGGSDAEVVVASDRVPARLPSTVGVVARGAALATSGFAEARWLDDHEGQRVVARVYAHAAPAQRTLSVLDGGGALIAESVVAVAPGRDAVVIIPIPAVASDDLSLELSGPDPLPFDDRVALVRPQHTSVRVFVSASLEKTVARALAGVPDAELVAAAPGAHLQIVDATAVGEPPPGAWRMRIAPGPAAPVLGPFLARRGHPLLADVDFTGVLWCAGATGIPTDATVLLAAGDAVLASETRRGRDRLIDLALDLDASTLRSHPSWPSLIANLVAARRTALSGVGQPNVLIGRPATATLPIGEDTATLTTPDGRTARLHADEDGQIAVAMLQAGIHRIDVAGKPWQRINALPLDPRLGDLADAATSTREPTAADRHGPATAERRRSPLALILPLVIAALAAMGAWSAFRREEG